MQKFLHDPAGNLLKRDKQDNNGNRTLNYGDNEYHYDAAGNLKTRTTKTGAQQFYWDANNRLLCATDHNGSETRMTYDAQGRRLSKQSHIGTTHFHWDGDQLLADRLKGKTREYVYYPNSFEPLAIIEENGSINLIHTDAVGLPQEVTNEDGNIVWSASYDALGNTTRIDSTNFDNPLRFQGQYYDEEIDLNYNRYRYFDSKTSSFISQDPLGLAAGSNTYAYAPNVWSWIDPLGLCKSLKGRTASVDEGKLDYLFGKAKGGKNAGHNLPRTNQNAAQMRRLGLSYTVEGRAMVRSHLDEVVQNDSNILKLFKNEYGSFEVRESLFSGPSGKFSKFESTWELMPDGSRRLTNSNSLRRVVYMESNECTLIPEEFELISFFESEPVESFPNDGFWCFEKYDGKNKLLRVSFNILEKSIQTALYIDGEEIDVVSHEGAEKIYIKEEFGCELFCCVCKDAKVKIYLQLSLKPNIHIQWHSLIQKE